MMMTNLQRQKMYVLRIVNIFKTVEVILETIDWFSRKSRSNYFCDLRLGFKITGEAFISSTCTV